MSIAPVESFTDELEEPFFAPSPEEQRFDELHSTDAISYSADGMYYVPAYLIEENWPNRLEIQAKQWRSLRYQHGHLNAAALYHNRQTIVGCYCMIPQYDSDGRIVKCFWFLRAAVDGGCDQFQSKFGERFLWQVPFHQAQRVAAAVKADDDEAVARGSMTEEMRHTLYSTLAPTDDIFHPLEFAKEGVVPVPRLTNWYDQLFAVSVKPSASLEYMPPALPLQAPILVRPDKKQAERVRSSQCLDLSFGPESNTPDDVARLIVDDAVWSLATSPHKYDWKALLKLRTVSRTFRDAVDAALGLIMYECVVSMTAAQFTGRVQDLALAHEDISAVGLVALPLACEGATTSHLAMMRLRSGKGPQERPPSADDVRAMREGLKYLKHTVR